MITIKKLNSETFEVTISSRVTTTHTVTLPQAYYEKLTNNKVTPEVLVEKSFEFLLERESNTSILRSFELAVISSFFSDYERIITQMII